MTARVTERYPWIADEQKEPFRQACIAGADPIASCPLCGGHRLTQEPQYRFCDEHVSWEHSGHTVACWNCKIRWGVICGHNEHHMDCRRFAAHRRGGLSEGRGE